VWNHIDSFCDDCQPRLMDQRTESCQDGLFLGLTCMESVREQKACLSKAAVDRHGPGWATEENIKSSQSSWKLRLQLLAVCVCCSIISSSMIYYTFFFLLGLVPQAVSHIVELNWDVTWVTASPDGFTRPVIGINNHFPCPAIEVRLGMSNTKQRF
jgi:hypothetical protein